MGAGAVVAVRDGSSPRERGTPEDGALVLLFGRFIPARAGNTRTPRPLPVGSTVHPRASGEHPIRVTLATTVVGSSPREREHSFCAFFQARYRGSSPRERGTLRPGWWCARARRFIPARAGNTLTKSTTNGRTPVHPRASGNTLRAPWRFRLAPVHPRASGEHSRQRCHPSHSGGSSPRERGTPRERWLAKAADRFIPARAGNTLNASSSSSRYSVHPRASGEHGLQRSDDGNCGGSSPRERGTRINSDAITAAGRFIPARAGNTGTPSAYRVSATVHPRASGEHGRPSPSIGEQNRFIPARAGNTMVR